MGPLTLPGASGEILEVMGDRAGVDMLIHPKPTREVPYGLPVRIALLRKDARALRDFLSDILGDLE